MRRKTTKTSRVIAIRMPEDLEAAIREEAEERGQPYQTVLKDLLRESLGMGERAEVRVIPSTALQHATRTLRKKDV